MLSIDGAVIQNRIDSRAKPNAVKSYDKHTFRALEWENIIKKE